MYLIKLPINIRPPYLRSQNTSSTVHFDPQEAPLPRRIIQSHSLRPIMNYN
jgi:hypothetical protein